MKNEECKKWIEERAKKTWLEEEIKKSVLIKVEEVFKIIRDLGIEI